MKIAIDARFFGTETGIGRYVKELVENLERVDLENQYVIFLSAKNFDLYQPKNNNFQKKLADIKWYSLEEQLKMGGIIDAERADLAHFPHFNVPFFCKTPFIVTIHDLILRHYPTSAASTKNPIIFYLKYLAYNFILKRALRRAKKIIVPTYFVKNDLLSVIPAKAGIQKNNIWIPDQVRDDKREELADKIRVAGEGLSNLPQTDLGSEFLKAKGIITPYILYVGNAYPHKNLEKLIEAFAELKKEKPELQLVFVGKRDYFSKNLESRIANRELKKSIIFYGFASDDELATLYKHASFYVFPSLIEGFGLPPLEAMSFGAPVACSDIPVFHEVLGEAAFYFNPNNPKDIKDVMELILGGARKDMSSAAILSRYSWKRNVEETKDIYAKFR